MKINIDFQRSADQMAKATNQFLVRDYVEFAINQQYKEGAKSQTLRQIARIQRVLDEGVTQGLEEVTLDQADMDFIRDVMEKTSFDVSLAKYVIVLQDELRQV